MKKTTSVYSRPLRVGLVAIVTYALAIAVFAAFTYLYFLLALL